MIVLLDTHSLMFLLDERLGRFGKGGEKAIVDAQRVVASAASFYEIGQLARLQRVAITDNDVRNLERECIEAEVEILPTTPSCFTEASLLQWENRDPFDRVIIAAAIETGATLVTKDRAITAYAAKHPNELRVIW